MRYSTPEENAAINKYLDSVSTVIGHIDDIPLNGEITIKTTDFEIPIEIMKEIKNCFYIIVCLLILNILKIIH